MMLFYDCGGDIFTLQRAPLWGFLLMSCPTVGHLPHSDQKKLQIPKKCPWAWRGGVGGGGDE